MLYCQRNLIFRSFVADVPWLLYCTNVNEEQSLFQNKKAQKTEKVYIWRIKKKKNSSNIHSWVFQKVNSIFVVIYDKRFLVFYNRKKKQTFRFFWFNCYFVRSIEWVWVFLVDYYNKFLFDFHESISKRNINEKRNEISWWLF